MDLHLKTSSTSGTRSEPFLNRHALDAFSVTIDVADLTEGTHYPDGYLPAGVPLGKVTATGKYRVYDDGASDGSQVLEGLLYTDIDNIAGATTVHGPMVIEAIVKESKLPIAIDAPGKADNVNIQYRP